MSWDRLGDAMLDIAYEDELDMGKRVRAHVAAAALEGLASRSR
jgi:hypothetical protein